MIHVVRRLPPSAQKALLALPVIGLAFEVFVLLQ